MAVKLIFTVPFLVFYYLMKGIPTYCHLYRYSKKNRNNRKCGIILKYLDNLINSNWKWGNERIIQQKVGYLAIVPSFLLALDFTYFLNKLGCSSEYTHRECFEREGRGETESPFAKGPSRYPTVPDYSLIDSGTQTVVARA